MDTRFSKTKNLMNIVIFIKFFFSVLDQYKIKMNITRTEILKNVINESSTD